MALLKQTPMARFLRLMAGLALLALFTAGATGQALAHDDDEIVTYGPNACTSIADLPAYHPATCVKHKVEVDDGVTETTNDYVTQTAADAVRRAFETTFQKNGWTVVKAEQDTEDQEWDYTIVKGLRRVKVEVEAQEPDEGTGTGFSIEED
jgi:hypothetical protein